MTPPARVKGDIFMYVSSASQNERPSVCNRPTGEVNSSNRDGIAPFPSKKGLTTISFVWPIRSLGNTLTLSFTVVFSLMTPQGVAGPYRERFHSLFCPS